jgi:hypothetical protein
MYEVCLPGLGIIFKGTVEDCAAFIERKKIGQTAVIQLQA